MSASVRPETLALALRGKAVDEPLRIEVHGTSMGRAVRGGGHVHVHARPQPRVGEVWAFATDGERVVVHRCRGRNPAGWLFEGDSVGRADRPVPESWLIGRVVAVEHGARIRRLGRAHRLAGVIAIAARRARRAARRG